MTTITMTAIMGVMLSATGLVAIGTDRRCRSRRPRRAA